MELYFSPLACSLATRIAFYEAGYEARYIQVDTKRKQLPDGGDFLAINPLGLVPVLRTDDGMLLTENVAILPYVADRLPEARLAPTDVAQRAKLHQWLGLISTELHKGVFTLLLGRGMVDEIKRYAREQIAAPFDLLHAHFAQQDWLLDSFSVADGLLTVVLNWARYCEIDLARWPALEAYFERVTARPAVERAISEELALYREQMNREQTV